MLGTWEKHYKWWWTVYWRILICKIFGLFFLTLSQGNYYSTTTYDSQTKGKKGGINSLISPGLQLEATSGLWHRKGKTKQSLLVSLGWTEIRVQKNWSTYNLYGIELKKEVRREIDPERCIGRSCLESLIEYHSAHAISRERTITRELVISSTIPKDYTELRSVQIHTSQSAQCLWNTRGFQQGTQKGNVMPW